MRAAPAVSVTAVMPASTCVVVGLLGLAATFTTLWWAGVGGGLRFCVPLASLAWTLALLAGLHAQPVRRLRWDGAAWWLKLDRPSADEVCGDAIVAFDLGAFVLLRFVAGVRPSRARSIWLPLQRSRIEGDWHALRCALYTPRVRIAAPVSEALDA